MDKITCRPRSTNGNDQQEAASITSSLSLNSSARDGSLIVSPGFSKNNINHLTINNNTVFKRYTRKRKPEPASQGVLSDTDASPTAISRSSIKEANKAKSSKTSPSRRSPIIRPYTVEGEITGALVTSKYHCTDCDSTIPSWPRRHFSVRCPRCNTNCRCDKVQHTCNAKMTLQLSDSHRQRFTLHDSLLHSIVRFKPQGYCDTERIEEDILSFGRVRVGYENGVVRSVKKLRRIRERRKEWHYDCSSEKKQKFKSLYI